MMVAMLDTRRPLLVTADFHARLASELAPLGFAAQKKAFVRKRGKTSHRIEMSSSHHNTEGSVTAWLGLIVTDAEIARVERRYRAGGLLGSAAFCAEPPQKCRGPVAGGCAGLHAPREARVLRSDG